MTELTEAGLEVAIACAVCLVFVAASRAWAVRVRDFRLIKRCERVWTILLVALCTSAIIAIVGL